MKMIVEKKSTESFKRKSKTLPSKNRKIKN